MKRFLFCLLNIIAIFGLTRAEEPDTTEVLYSIERTLPYQTIMTDGARHSVPRTSIDRIEFSRTDTLGYEHQDYVSQIIILNSGDSIVLPIADIQSFEFQTPPTKYAPGVTVIDRDGLWEHVVESDIFSFVLDNSTPSELIPAVGQRLVTLRSEDPFPCGFSGEVETVTKRSDGTTLIECKYVDLTETVLEHVESVVFHPYTDNYEPSSSVRAKKSGAGGSNVSISIPFNFENTIESEFKPFVKPSKYFEVAGSGNVKLSFTNKITLGIDLTTILSYGDRFTDCCISLTHEKGFYLSGTGAFEGTITLFEAETPPIPLGTFFNAYVKLTIPFKFGFDVTGEARYSTQDKYALQFYHSTNSNIQSFIKRPEITHSEEAKANITTDFNASVGPELEVGIRTNGYETLPVSAGVKLSAKYSLGVQFKGSYVVPYEDAATSTLFYDKEKDDCKLELGLYAGYYLGLEAGVKVKKLFGDKKEDGKENGFEWIIINPNFTITPEFAPFWERYKYPEFINPSLNLRKTQSGIDEYSFDVDTKLANPVWVGYRIMDDETDEIINSYYATTPYDGKDPKQFKFSVSSIPMLVGRKSTIYPLVKPKETGLFDVGKTEILASKGVPIKVDVTPITGKATNIGLNDATVYGEIENYFFLSASVGHECGFLYSTQSIHSGSPKVKCKIAETIRANLSNLKSGTTYYYAAYIKVGDEYIIGDVYNFTTLEDEYVDLGLSVKWCVKNIGAYSETDYGNLYAWGEISPKSTYNWDTYFDSPYDSNGNMAGCRLKTTSLGGDALYDVVAANEEGARMPTKAEMLELINNCVWEWTTVNGVNGYRVSSKVNSNSIFIPAAGMQDGSEFANGGTYGGYWTSTIGSSATKMAAVNLYFTSSMKSTQQGNRYVGRSIRAVKP